MDEKAILLVDDEAIILMAIVQELRSMLGPVYRYETAASLQEAREVMAELAQEGIPLVACVSDWLMPGGRGDGLLGEIRAAYPEAVLIIVSGYADDGELRQACLDLGVVAHIAKPWGRQQIAKTLMSSLSRS